MNVTTVLLVALLMTAGSAWLRSSASDSDCQEGQVACPSDTSTCIPLEWVCDGISDCPGAEEEGEHCDADDEEGGDAWIETGCAQDYLACPSDHNTCIPEQWICDGISDCPQNEDEDEGYCGDEPRCEEGYVACTSNTSHCIAEAWMCDGNQDCPDNEDEVDCNSAQPCDEGLVACPSDPTICISEQWICDGITDCPQAEDEHANCPGNDNEFTCETGTVACPSSATTCIPEEWICDGYNDCPDAEEEDNCSA